LVDLEGYQYVTIVHPGKLTAYRVKMLQHDPAATLELGDYL